MISSAENIGSVKTILLIDDDSDEHQLFSDALVKYNNSITCLTAYNCSEGYSLAQQKKPDIIFLDMNLPGTHGLACLRKIKKTYPLHDVTVYMYSAGSVTNKDIVTALQEGAKKWIKKPDNLDDYNVMFTTYLN
jgi:DNA-binding response OmpR family regulator